MPMPSSRTRPWAFGTILARCFIIGGAEQAQVSSLGNTKRS
jgi:hypothetical protein